MATTETARLERKALADWWRIQGFRFLTTATVTAATLVAIGWISGLRQVMHGALLSVAVAALLPFLVVACVLLVILLLGFVLGLLAVLAEAGHVPDGDELDGAGEVVAEGGGWLIRRYYALLGRQRHPLFWGLLAGVFFGGLLLWALIALFVVPGETRTVRLLGEAKLQVDRIYAESGEFPRPYAERQLRFAGATAGTAESAAILKDGFGRPFTYEVSGRRKLASWTLTSMGFDGKPSADDLCISGSTRLMEWAQMTAHIARLLEGIQSGSGSLGDRLAGIRSLQCPTE